MGRRPAFGYSLRMPSVSRTFSVTPPPAAVVDYLKDFANAEDWDPGTQTCTRTDSGAVAEGAAWHNVSNIFGVKAELTYVLRELTDDKVVFVGTNKSSTSTDTISVVPDGTGSKLTYHADLEMNGAAKLLNPVMKLVFEKLANDTEKQMVTVLNGLN
jgi:carbon monoxide dehydrogenase subunit G